MPVLPQKRARLAVPILLISLLSSVAFFFVLKPNSRMETDLDKYMPQTHPAFVFSNEAEKAFNIKDGIIIAISRPEGIYQPETIAKVKRLTKALQKMPEIAKGDVTSLYTADNIIGSAEGLQVKPFFKRAPTTPEGVEQLRQKVRANEMSNGRLVSDDETVTIIVADLEDDVFSQGFYRRIIDLARSYEGPEQLYVG